MSLSPLRPLRPVVGHVGHESTPVAQAEARAAAPLRVSAVASVALSRLRTVTPDTPLVQVAALLSSAQISVAVVTDAEGCALGTVTETLLVRHLGLGRADLFTTRAAAVMTPDLPSCAPDDLLCDVLAHMHAQGLTFLLLLDAEHHALGIVNARDGLRALLAAGNDEAELMRNYVTGVGYQ